MVNSRFNFSFSNFLTTKLKKKNFSIRMLCKQANIRVLYKHGLWQNYYSILLVKYLIFSKKNLKTKYFKYTLLFFL